MPVPKSFLAFLPDDIREMFRRWERFLHEQVDFSMPDSSLHAKEHTARVLLYALMLGATRYPRDGRTLEILAHAALFHDTRRKNEWYDTGHGARASVHYKDFCQRNGLKYHPESSTLIRFHDLDDERGKKAISNRFGENASYVSDLYAIFKDADALDRWRLGVNGLDSSYLRHDESRELVNFSHSLVESMVQRSEI